ncbi:hypothetical protein [Flagellimonas beolgyonensis]|uniref:hypothetical protein n=1 Tax=Flagellimonas beolgyonensis TaxID=864064 RepID=UPI003D6527CF
MEPKTNESYKKEIIERYRIEKGGEMRGYLSNPTRKQIREACLWLLDKRRWKYDEQTLNRFFQFNEEKSKKIQIQQLNPDRYVPIVKFLKGKTNDTSIENLELIAWLIDFKPRPLIEYLNSNNAIHRQESIQQDTGVDTHPKKPSQISEPPPTPPVKKKTRKLIITISIAFGAVLLTALVLKDVFFKSKPIPSHNSQCMAWADSLYLEVSCSAQPFTQYGTKAEPLDPIKLQGFKKIEVNMATQFFADDGKPMIWYYKNKDGEIEYFTAPGLHPITGETLRKITPYIIETYVPIHSNNPDSFINQ